jgi:hypothetical protein
MHLNSSDDYKFDIPIYEYTNNKVDYKIELYRYKLIKKLVNKIFKKILEEKKKVQNEVKLKLKLKSKVSQYLSQMIMSVLSDRTNQYKSKIILEDGLFLIPNQNQLNNFYRDINYYCNTNFEPDFFSVVQTFSNNIAKIKKFMLSIPNNIQSIKTVDMIIVKKYDPKNEINFNLNKSTIKRLQKKFTLDKKYFRNYLVSCIIRYAALGSGANQFMVDLEYKKKLQEHGFNFECFASIFNHYFKYYCSMFYDLEKYFGSKGSFFALKIHSGKYMANPPYDEKLLYNMYNKIKNIVTRESTNILFIMSIPEWKDFKLEKDIDTDNLYLAKKIKTEKFHNPYNLSLCAIPPYISYLFNNSNFTDVDQITSIFSTYTNMLLIKN